MISMINDENSRLRKLEHQLYATDMIAPPKRSILHDDDHEVPDDWVDPSMEPVRFKKPGLDATSFFKNLFRAALVFLVVACIVLGISMLSGNNTISTKNVDITLTTKSFADGGESLPVQVSVVNRNRVPLELATLVLEYPEGSAEDSGALARITRDAGTIGAGETHQEAFTVQLYGQEGSQKQLTAHLEFRVPGSNAVYDKDEIAAVTVRTSPVRLTLTATDKAIPNQEVPFKFTIIGNGTATLGDTTLIVQYPDGFTFTRSDVQPTSGNNIWYLGDLPPGVNRTITAYGTIAGGSNDLKTIRASIGVQSKKNEKLLDTTYNSVAQTITMTSSFLKTNLSLNDKTTSTVAVTGSEDIQVILPWQNVTGAELTNVEIRVRLGGSAYDPSKVKSSTAFFDSANNQLVWTKQESSVLASVAPGQEGTFSFAIAPRATNVTNPTITFTVDIAGIQSGGVALTATGVDTKKAVVSSDLNLLAKTLHYGGQIQNSGPMPPAANKETTYTVDLQVTNVRNKVSGVKVATILPVNVVWKNMVLPQSEAANVSYNSVTREVVWNVGDVPAGTGTTTSPRSVAIKVGITPSLNQVGLRPDMTGEFRITGKDMFTNTDILFTKKAVTTLLLNDISTTGADGKVVQ